MHIVYIWLFPVVWGAWCLYWTAASLTVKRTHRSEGIASRLSHTIPLVLAIVLMVSPRLAGGALRHPILPWSPPLFWLGAAMLVVGLLFAAVARWHLGGNWSGTITVKQDHTLTRSGPYRLVRHPIYTGILLGMAGSAVAIDQWRGLVAVLLVIAAFLRKIQIEERFMLGQFGDAYRQYRQEVAALIPGLL
jgi:protein-S-isoprenylcysteine O-methyltransferase Ste14